MWKVLIADDEPKVRRGLRATIEQSESDMIVVAEAEDGQSALRAVKEARPDILLVDIRMPFLDGLQLIEQINSLTRDCVIVVVTGHDEFEYAKRALQLRVFDFILKPISQDQLIDVLKRARLELEALRKQNRYVAWARDQLERNLPAIREEFMQKWVTGRLSQSEIDDQLDFLGIDFGQSPGMVVVRIMERGVGTAVARQHDRHLASLVIRNILTDTLQEFHPTYVFQDDYDDLVALTSSSGGEAWVDALPRIRSKAADSKIAEIILAQAAVSGGMSALPETYDLLVAELSDQGATSSTVLKINSFLEENYGRHSLTLEETAGAMKLSPGYLSRVLKQQTGLSFVDYLTRLRATKAAQLMLDPSVKIYEVAESVGFASQHYFSRAFKRVLGLAPVDYRKGVGDR